jgi:uncharacterized protein YndB with AHSA1/START domain
MAKQIACTYEIYIAAPADKVWKGIVDGEMTKHYVYGTRLESKLKNGSRTHTSGTEGSKSSMARFLRSSRRRDL